MVSDKKKGRMRYVLTRGIAFGILIFLVWLGGTILEILMSDFKRIFYLGYISIFAIRCVVWFIGSKLLGLTFANGMWKRKEKKFEYLS